MPRLAHKKGGVNMNKVYIISRYRASTEREQELNRNIARYFAKQIIYEDKIPVAPHLFYTQFLDDSIESERECGLGLGIHDLKHSDEFLLVIIDGVISSGMSEEIKVVSRLGMPGRIVTMSKREVLEQMKIVV